MVNMNETNTIEALINKLKSAEICDFPTILKSIQIPIQLFDEFCSWDQQCYTRNCIEKNDHFELILLCWNPHHETPIHDHDGQKCWVYQLAGNITEKRFIHTDSGPIPREPRLLKPGQLSYMDDRMGYHVLKNNSDQRCLSLHLYASPIEKCMVYDPQSKQFLQKELSYDQIIETV